jgi:hypothetical protein
MNAPELKSLTNPQGETMNDHIICETGEERPSTTFINPSVDSVSTSTTATIQGVSGANYAPMDTSPQPQETRLDQLTTLLNETLKQMVIEITNNKAQPDLPQAVETILQEANWFYDMVKETIEENHDIESLVDDRVDDRVGSAVDEWFSYNFTLTDHCDIDDIVGDALDDKLESIVEEKLEALLEEKLKHANITVSF